MNNIQKIVMLLDCDNCKLNIEIRELILNRYITVFAVANSHSQLPRFCGEEFGEVVKVYANSADFRLVARLATEISEGSVQRVLLITRDRAFSRAVHDYANLHHLCCERYSTFEECLGNDALLTAIQSAQIECQTQGGEIIATTTQQCASSGS